MTVNVSFKVTEDQYEQVKNTAAKKNLSITDYIKQCLALENEIFTAGDALRRALEKYKDNKDEFSIPDLYSNSEYQQLIDDIGISGAARLGRGFFMMIKDRDDIECLGPRKVVEYGLSRKRSFYRFK